MNPPQNNQTMSDRITFDAPQKKPKLKKDGTPKKAGGTRKGAGRKYAGDEGLCEFRVSVKKKIAKTYGRGDWELGVFKIKQLVQKSVNSQI